ncbi:glycoside hydrolase family 5 protein [Oligoflexus tunisiensis]|uniref:glycoside hydrolase family 5 protein n=1 Tax=Oligoflexus tunisiensis TaxID=708132 RepID=UPI000B2E3B93|nr:glycoside hydrolase family 5 protein [Oligoflexus tunisiensis]
MQTFRILSILALTGLLLTNCRADRSSIEGGQRSQLADVAIGNFDKPNWTRFDLEIERLRPEPQKIQKKYQRMDNQDLRDATIQVPFGDYKFLLTYRDDQDKILYESCAAEKAKEHSIQEPRYPVEIKICAADGQTPAGEVKPDEADVTINPVVTAPDAAGSFVAAHGMLSVAGGKIVDKNQKPIQLKGMSLFWSQWSGTFWNADVVATLKKDWKATLVRAAMGVEEGGYLTQPAAEKERVKTVVEAAIKEGLYVIIDWHDHHATRNADKAVEFFTEMATLYGNNPHVLFEIYNEPIDDSWDQVKAYAEKVIKAIRAKNAKNLVIVGSPTWSQRVDLAADNPIQDSNVAYTLHFYAGTHRQELRDKAAYAIQKGLALFVTEFGVCASSGNGNIDLPETDRWMEFMNKHGISWANWSLFDKDESASALKNGANPRGGWTDSDLTVSGAYIKRKIME